MILGSSKIITDTLFYAQDLAGLIRQCQAATIDLWFYWAEWLAVSALCAVWAGITFGLDVPGCAR